MPTGGARKGAGRPPGVKDKYLQAREAVLTEAFATFGDFESDDAVSFMIKVMRTGNIPMSYRMDAAKNVAKYQHATLSTVTVNERRAEENEAVRAIVASKSNADLMKLLGVTQPEFAAMKEVRTKKALAVEQEPLESSLLVVKVDPED